MGSAVAYECNDSKEDNDNGTDHVHRLFSFCGPDGRWSQLEGHCPLPGSNEVEVMEPSVNGEITALDTNRRSCVEIKTAGKIFEIPLIQDKFAEKKLSLLDWSSETSDPFLLYGESSNLTWIFSAPNTVRSVRISFDWPFAIIAEGNDDCSSNYLAMRVGAVERTRYHKQC